MIKNLLKKIRDTLFPSPWIARETCILEGCAGFRDKQCGSSLCGEHCYAHCGCLFRNITRQVMKEVNSEREDGLPCHGVNRGKE
mgnify:CR=1 FL=1